MHSIDIQKQLKNIAIRQRELTIAQAELYPQIDTQYNLNYTDMTVTGRDPLAKIRVLNEDMFVYPFPSSKYKSNFDLSLTQTLFAGGRILATIGVHNLRLDQEKIRLQQVRETLLAQAYEDYWRYVQAIREELYFKLQIDTLQSQKNNTDLKFSKGLISKINNMQIEIDLANAKEDLEQTQKNIHIQKIKLENTLNTSLPETISKNVRSLLQLERLWAQFCKIKSQEDPELKSLKLDLEIRSQQKTIENSRFYPEIFFQTGVDYFNSDNNSLKKAATDLKYGQSYAQIIVKWNLFNGFRDWASADKAQLEKETVEIELLTKEKQQPLALAPLTAQVENALSTVRRTQRNLELSQQFLKDHEIQLQANHLPPETLLITQESLRKSELNYAKALIEMELALVKWCRTAHTLDNYLKE